jgi:hypothetical protein
MGTERDEWPGRLRERAEESLRRRAARAATRRDMARRRSKGMESRIAEKLMRADLDAACADALAGRDD